MEEKIEFEALELKQYDVSKLCGSGDSNGNTSGEDQNVSYEE